MLVMTRMCGERLRNERQYSHPSTTKYLLFPATKLVLFVVVVDIRCPQFCGHLMSTGVSNRKLPMITVGSSPASIKILATIAVVVVFPCVPVIAMVYLSFEMTPSASGYDRIGIFRFFASTNSACSLGIAIV